MADETTTPMSTRALAELARAGYSSLRHPSMDVEFEVHHIRDEAGYLASVLNQDAPSSTFFETVTSSGNQVGLTIGTNTRRQREQPAVRNKGGMHDITTNCEPHPDRHVFTGSARPNLTFLYETARRFEAIVAIDPNPRSTAPLTMAEAWQLLDLLHEISRIAVQVADAPLLSVQCPVQLPMGPKAETDDRDIPDAASKAVRFAIALPRPSAEESLKLAEQITTYCEAHNLSLWIRDTRPGCRTGNWFTVLKQETHHSHGAKEPSHILPVTFVGPARIGSTYSVLNAFKEAPRLGVAGCSITLLDDLSFIHLQLALAYEDDARLTKDDTTGKDLAGFVKDVLRVTRTPDPVSNDGHYADDYQTLAGPLLPYAPPDEQRKLAIWFSWQMNRTVNGLSAPMNCLGQALDSLGLGWNIATPQANIEYLVCRDLGNSVLRGKGKLSVPYDVVRNKFPPKGIEPSASQLCVALEDAWKVAAAPMKDPDDERAKALRDANIREITVSWREFWLGHWAAPIA